MKSLFPIWLFSGRLYAGSDQSTSQSFLGEVIVSDFFIMKFLEYLGSGWSQSFLGEVIVSDSRLQKALYKAGLKASLS